MMRTLSLKNLPPDHFCTYLHHVLQHRQPGEPHDHDFHELFWAEESQGTHWINGQALPLQGGDLVLVRASDRHTICSLAAGPPLRIVNFAFHASTWNHLRRRYFGGASIFFSQPALAARSYRLDEFQLAAVRQSAALLRSGLRKR